MPIQFPRLGVARQAAQTAQSLGNSLQNLGQRALYLLKPAPLSPGDGTAMTRSVLPLNKTQAVQGQLTGPRMLVVDNPESFQKPGVLGSSINTIPGRGGGRVLFQGQGDVFALANNRTGKPQRFQVAVYNPSDKPMTVTYTGSVYSHHVTKTDGKIPSGYAEGRFGGPHAVVGRAHLEAVNGKNGYQTVTVTIPPRSSGVLVDQYQEAGGEVFARGNITARTPDGKPASFGTAVVAMPNRLNADQLKQLTDGTLPAAGVPSDYAPADKNRYGRPNGVTTGGGTFVGGRTIDVSKPGGDTADLVMATKIKNAGSTAEIARLTSVPGNLQGAGSAATQDDGNYGVSYQLDYTLNNPSKQDREVQVLLTSPRSKPDEKHGPLGGEMTLPLRINGNILNVRVDDRGDGVQIAKIKVPAGQTARVSIDFTNFGNNFPPAGIEFRSK